MKKVIAWFLPKKALIKFNGEDEPLKVAENVISESDFAKNPIKKGNTVEVTIKDDEVTSLKKVGAEDKKEEPKKEAEKTKDENPPVETPTPDEKKETAKSTESTTETLTVEAIYDNKSVKFKEKQIGKYKWTKVSEELAKVNFKELGLQANNQVTITLNSGNIITKVELVAEEKKEEKKTESSLTSSDYKKSSYSNSTNDSIERQVALKEAGAIIRSYIETKGEPVNTIEKVEVLIPRLTKVCLDALHNIK